MSVVFLGLDKDHWDLINSFANWVSAIGTMGAVITSLWLALRPDRLKLEVSAGIRMLVIPGGGNTSTRYVTITAVNQGRRPAKVTGIGWMHGGRRKKHQRHLLQMPGDQTDRLSSAIPVLLDDGQQAQWMFEKDEWLEQIGKLYTNDWRATAKTFSVVVSTSVGQQFIAPVEKSLKDALTKAFDDYEHGLSKK